MVSSEKDFYKYVGEKISIARQAAKISQAELAIKVGLKRTSITNIEAGHQKIQTYTLFLIAEVLHIQILTLLPPTSSSDTDKGELISSQEVITKEGTRKTLSETEMEKVLKVIR